MPPAGLADGVPGSWLADPSQALAPSCSLPRTRATTSQVHAVAARRRYRTHAARATGRSKALISKYVRELEDELGTRLLNRTTRKLSPTEAGSAYYVEAQALVQRLDELNESVLDSHSRPRGRLKVTAPRTAGEGELGHAIMEFVRAHPEAERPRFGGDGQLLHQRAVLGVQDADAAVVPVDRP